jgi:phosphate transport system protein
MGERVQRHFEEVLDDLKEKVLRLGGLTEQAIGRAVRSLVDRDSELAKTVIAEDIDIDRLELEIDDLCVEALARFQPIARDLRFITTAMKITSDLERIADHACNISERALELNDEPVLKPLIDIPLMANRAQEMVRNSLDCFVRRDAEGARATIALDRELNVRMEQIFRELLSYMMEDPRNVSRALRLTFVAKYFERIGDMAKNICEQVVFMAEGEVIKHLRAQHRTSGDGEP